MRRAAVALFAVFTIAQIAGGIAEAAAQSVPRAVSVARATTIPVCTRFVDAGFAGVSNGTAAKPHKTIAAAINAAAAGAVICVAEGRSGPAV